jgi:hypothetical protein
MAPKQRQAINGPRLTGTITEWKDKFGWIQPAKPVNHPLASKRQGKIFLALEDVVEELDGVGATISFTLYSDSSGLGAGDVKMAKGTPETTVAKGASNGKGKAKATTPAAKTNQLPKAAPKSAAAKAAAARALAVKAPEPVEEEEEAAAAEEEQDLEEPPLKKFKGDGKAFGKDAKGKAKGKGKGKGKGKDKDPGPREIIHEEPLFGTVVEWKGKFGWIKPNDTIEHPLAQKHRGDLFLLQEDVEAEIDGVGANVQFMLYQDNKGLGACNVQPA